MKRLLLILLILPQLLSAKVSVTNPKTEGLVNPLGIDAVNPRFSWQIMSDKKEVVQTAYQIVVSSDGKELWNSGKVTSDQQLWIPYQGVTLKSNQHCTWQVKVFTNKGESDWCEPQQFSMGLLSESKWRGRWIGLESLQPGEQQGRHSKLAARYLRKEFDLQDKPIKRATAFVAGLGVYEMYVNGWHSGYDISVLQPVPSDYRKTIYYNTYDITEALKDQVVDRPSEQRKHNCIGIVLGNGRYFAMRQDKPYKNATFGLPKCRINIIIEYEDGTTQRVQTDETWKVTANGPIRANNEYDGEEYDARMEMPGWNQVGFDDSAWQQAERTAIPTGTLRAQMMPGMRSEECGVRSVEGEYSSGKAILPPPSTLHTPPLIIDFGQNISGWVSFVPQGKEGDTIRIRYAERLNDDGTLYTANLRTARSEDIFVCGKENREWRPTFVWHGFRYVEVKGKATDFKAHLVADAMNSTGQFSCSDTIINKVVKNAWWGIIDNYKGMPLDCPQRDERQPWLGDRTVGSLGESFLFDNERLYAKWMRDICEAQRSDGNIPDVAPAFWNYYSDNLTWPAALPFSCDMLWRQYGNEQPIIDSYPSIRKWMLHIMEEYLHDGIITKDQYGDWCVPPEKLELIHSQDPARKTDGALLSTAYAIRCLQLLESFATLQGLTEEAQDWAQRRQAMSEAFNRKFLTVKRGTSPRHDHVLYPDSVFYGNNTATANLLPLAFGLVPDSCKDDVVRNVVENIMVRNRGHVSCGVIGISWLLRVLSDNGFADVAYLLARQKSYPSWGYMAEHGATTIWELWNGNTADPAMNSGNHVMLLGDLLTWCYQYLGGLRSSDAYKHIVLKPSFDIQDCFNTDVTYLSPYGPVISRWKKTLEHLDWHVEIPCNTVADVCLPSGEVRRLGSGSYDLSVKIPTAHPAIIKDEFPYEMATFPSCHASTIVERRNGDLVCAYFGGTYERDPDVCIWVSIKKKGEKEWSDPILAADGVFELGSPQALMAGISEKTTDASAGPCKSKGNKRKSCWNPVLFEMPDGELLLFYKIGFQVSDWTGWLVRSRDGGRTWSDHDPLPEGFLGPIKNKPILLGDKLLCGSSTEINGWRFHVEILDTKTGEWKYVGPIESTVAVKTDDNQPHPIDCIQPSFLKLKDGRLQVLMRTHNAKLATSFSSDNGETWTPVTLSEIGNNQSGTDAVTLRDGRHVLIYNNFETLPNKTKGPRTPLSLAISDDGEHWQHLLTLEDSPVGEYSYPAIIQGKDGTLHCVYTWQRERIAYKQVDLNKINGTE